MSVIVYRTFEDVIRKSREINYFISILLGSPMNDALILHPVTLRGLVVLVAQSGECVSQ